MSAVVLCQHTVLVMLLKIFLYIPGCQLHSLTPMTPHIVYASRMTPMQSRYWLALRGRLGNTIDLIDPFRHSLRELRQIFPSGLRIYRASTGGKYGKSATITTL